MSAKKEFWLSIENVFWSITDVEIATDCVIDVDEFKSVLYSFVTVAVKGRGAIFCKQGPGRDWQAVLNNTADCKTCVESGTDREFVRAPSKFNDAGRSFDESYNTATTRQKLKNASHCSGIVAFRLRFWNSWALDMDDREVHLVSNLCTCKCT